jgi:hypothetical protein
MSTLRYSEKNFKIMALSIENSMLVNRRGQKKVGIEAAATSRNYNVQAQRMTNPVLG